MDRSSFVESLGRDADRMLAVAGPHLGLEVPACPGWDVGRLVGHVGRVYRAMAYWMTQGTDAASRGESLERAPTGDAVVAWTAAARDEVVAALDGLPGDGAAVPTWLGEQPPGFWFRRMAVETAVHRWDAESAVAAAGGPGAGPVDAALAVEGVDELFTVLLPFRHPGAFTGDGETLHFHATDAEGEWVLTLGPGAPAVEHAHRKSDVAARGAASDLLLFLHNRASQVRLATFGDTALLDRWTGSVRL